MFGLSWGQIAIIGLVAVFLLGPERIPTAVSWIMSTLRKLRTMAAGAQAELRKEIGPELDELRRQVAELQSLKEVQELRELRDLHPKRIIGRNILGDEFSGGISGFLGLNGTAPDAPGSAARSAGPIGGSPTSPSASGSRPTGEESSGHPPSNGSASPPTSDASSGHPPSNGSGSPSGPASGNGSTIPTAAAAPAPKPAPAVAGSPPFDSDGT